MTDRTESLIREAFAAEADRAPDPRPVLAALARRRPPRRTAMALLAAGLAVAVAAVAVVLVPRLLDRAAPPTGGTPPPADQDVLLVGLDSGDRTDSMMLAHVDTDGRTNVVSLPRDSWVAVPGLGMRRLNAVYAEAGIEPLLETVRDLTGVAPDHYALVDMAAFGELASAVGGVEVCVRLPTADPRTGVTFPAGNQTVSGATALAYLRQRIGLDEGDFDRIVRLQAFLQSALVKLREEPDSLRHVLGVVNEHATLDPGWDVLGLAERLRDTDSRQLSFDTIPILDETYVSPSAGAVLRVDPAAVRAYVADLFGPDHAVPGHQDPRGRLPTGVERPCVD